MKKLSYIATAILCCAALFSLSACGSSNATAKLKGMSFDEYAQNNPLSYEEYIDKTPQPQREVSTNPSETTTEPTTTASSPATEAAAQTTASTEAETQPTTSTEAKKSPLEIYKEESIAKVNSTEPELHGIDISKYQADQPWKDYIDQSDAVIMRYSAGTVIDPYFDSFMTYAMEQKKLVGIYFYTNPLTWSTWDPQEYAQWCYDQTKDYIGYAVYVLDCEAGRLDSDWILAYLEEFKRITGVKPIFYTNQKRINDAAGDEALKQIRAKSYGLWVARYGENNGEVTDFEISLWEDNKVFGHQYSTEVEDLDRDIFFCTAEAWYKYAASAGK